MRREGAEVHGQGAVAAGHAPSPAGRRCSLPMVLCWTWHLAEEGRRGGGAGSVTCAWVMCVYTWVWGGLPRMPGWALAIGTPARAGVLICTGAEVPAPASHPLPLVLLFACLCAEPFLPDRGAFSRRLPPHASACTRADACAEACASGWPVGAWCPCVSRSWSSGSSHTRLPSLARISVTHMPVHICAHMSPTHMLLPTCARAASPVHTLP